LIKSLVFILLVFWVRTTLPRLRIDQLMSYCWKLLLPLSIVALMVNGFFIVYDWPHEILGLINWAAAGALLAFIFTRGRQRRKEPSLVGAYKRAGALAP
jgi:NADH-quinone oxidoreductase subunit H